MIPLYFCTSTVSLLILFPTFVYEFDTDFGLDNLLPLFVYLKGKICIILVVIEHTSLVFLTL